MKKIKFWTMAGLALSGFYVFKGFSNNSTTEMLLGIFFAIISFMSLFADF